MEKEGLVPSFQGFPRLGKQDKELCGVPWAPLSGGSYPYFAPDWLCAPERGSLSLKFLICH